MPARRRNAGFETDDHCSMLIDCGIDNQVVEDNFSGDEKKKYATPKSFYSVGGYTVPAPFAVPKGLTKFSSSIGAFIQQSLIQQTDDEERTALFTNTSQVIGQFDQQSSNDVDRQRNNLLFLDDTEDNNLVVMASRDRTGEFASAIRAAQARNIQRAVNIKDPRKATQLQTYSEFMMIAKHIGKNIASTYSKLEKLTLLAKRKSLFDDRPTEIQELTYIIKGDLNSLNQQIARLQDISKSQRRATNAKHLNSHSSNMVLALQTKLASMTMDFKQVQEVRTENLKHQKNRRDQFSQGGIAANLPPPSMRGDTQGSILLSDQDQVSIDLDASQPLLPNRTQTQMMLYDESDEYVQQRAESTQQIESTIVELGGIFQQLAHLVQEQGEMVERIDTNVQDAEMNIEAAHGEILKYFQTVSKNRWLMIKIFGVLIFFFIFFIIFMA